MKAKTERNEQIVSLRDSDPGVYSFGKLSEMFNISKQTAHEIYHLEKVRQEQRKGLSTGC